MMKRLMVIMAGMADEPLEVFDGKTPLYVADTPHLDRLASRGRLGRVRLVPDGIRPAEEISAFSMLGYNSKKQFPGRGRLEQSVLDLKTEKGDAVLACGLVTAVDGKMVDPTAGNISVRESAALIEGLNRRFRKWGIRWKAGREGIHVLRVEASEVPEGLDQLDLFPPEECVGKKWGTVLPRGRARSFVKDIIKEAAAALEQHDVNKVRIDLNENPANLIWLWGMGRSEDLPSFESTYPGKTAVLTQTGLMQGIAKAAGIHCERLNEDGESVFSVLGDCVARLRERRKTHDTVIIYLDHADTASREGDFRKKVRWIEAFDEHLMGPVIKELKGNERVLVSTNHVTRSEDKIQKASPAPFLICEAKAKSAGRTPFNEETAAKSGWLLDGGEALLREYFKVNEG